MPRWRRQTTEASLRVLQIDTYPTMILSWPSSALRSDFENAHHSMILMVQDVAVEHPHAGIVVVAHDEAQSLMLGDIHDVLPGTKRFRDTVTVDHLELESVQMK